MHAQSLYLLLFSLYWAQGLPVGFMTHALPVILRAEGLSLAQIGGFGLLMLPWSLKVFWAPWVDRLYGKAGCYRSWILPTQLLTVVVLGVLSYFPIATWNGTSDLLGFFCVLLILNLLGATQDIATDGLAVHSLSRQQQPWGNSLQVIGSRLGFIVGGGGVLWSLEGLGWQATFAWLAVLVLLNTYPVWRAKPLSFAPLTSQPAITASAAGWDEFKHAVQRYWQDRSLRSWLWVLLSFKVADGLAGPLLKPLVVDLGLSLSQIGIYISMLGAAAALIGAALAAYALKWLSRANALISFSLLKIVSLLAYLWLAWQYEQQQQVAAILIYTINALEDLCSAMLLMVMLTLIMQYCRTQWAATDFTVQVALMATVSGLLYSLGGGVAQIWGYSTTLAVIVVIAVICLYPIFAWKRMARYMQ